MAARTDNQTASTERILDELELIRASLLPHETITFLDEDEAQVQISDDPTVDFTSADASSHSREPEQAPLSVATPKSVVVPGGWRTRVGAERADASISSSPSDDPLLARLGTLHPARIALRSERAPVWLEVTFRPGSLSTPDVRVHTERLARTEHARWQDTVRQHAQEPDVVENEYPTYALLTRLLPLLPDSRASEPTALQATRPKADHGRNDNDNTDDNANDEGNDGNDDAEWHALLTSHHLKSPSKRRTLAQRSAALSLTGLAKIGYPGVIYASGRAAALRAFVAEIKALNWLTLRLRFLEPLPGDARRERRPGGEVGWREFEKVGEVVAFMREWGRERFVLEMGIGSAS
jgi:hypothetical protein